MSAMRFSLSLLWVLIIVPLPKVLTAASSTLGDCSAPSAYLVRGKDGKVGFEFEPRPVKAGAADKAAAKAAGEETEATEATAKKPAKAATKPVKASTKTAKPTTAKTTKTSKPAAAKKSATSKK